MKKNQQLQKQLYLYYIYTFLKDLSFFAAVLVPFFTQWGGISQSQVQFLQSWFMLWFFILEVPTGAVADYLGRKYSLALGAISVSVAAVLYGSIPSFAIFLLGEFLFATAMSLISGADEAWLYDTLKEHRSEAQSKKIFGRVQSLHLGSMLIASIAGGFFAKYFGLNAPMLLSALPYLFAAGVALLLKEPTTHSAPSESKRYIIIVKEGVSYLLTHPHLKRLALDGTIVATAAYFVIWLYQPLVISLGVSVEYIGLIHASLLLIQMLISSHFEKLEKVATALSLPYQKFSAVLVSIGFLVAGLWPSWLSAGVFIVFAGGFGLSRLTYLSTKMQPHIESNRRATVLSSISMFRRFSLMIFNPAVGLLTDRSLHLALLLIGVLPLLSLLIKEENGTAS